MDDSAQQPAASTNLTELTAEVVSAYVAKNNVPAADLPSLLHNVHGALSGLGTPIEEPKKIETLVPAVPIKKSITDDYLIGLENGQKFKSLKRHLMTTYSMTPADYRAKWGLPKDYPMVAPAYAKARSSLAKTLGLGRKAMPTPAPVPVEAPAKKAARAKREAVAA